MVMNKQLIKSCQKIIIWLLAELLLNFCGLDTLADYSEYLYQINYLNLIEKHYVK